MAELNLIQLYVNVLTKTLVAVNGSPTQIPPMYYGDTPQFQLFPVAPLGGNPQSGYAPFDLTGYSSNLIMADKPNAASPPPPFASLDGLSYVKPASGFPYFQGVIDVTQAAVGTFIGATDSKAAYLTWDVFSPSLRRTTLLQTTFSMVASNDTPAAGPAGPAVQFLTLAQALNLFLLVGAQPGKFIIWQDKNSTHKLLQSLDTDGALKLIPLT